MRKLTAAAVYLCAVLAAGSSGATIYQINATARVSGLRSHDYIANTDSPVTNGLIGVGDAVNLNFMFDSDKARISSLYDADPTVNVYNLLASRVSFTAGRYSTRFSPTFDISSSLQLWNDRNIVGTLVDEQTFEASNYGYGGPYPFALTDAPVLSELIQLQSFDFTHTARDSDLISSLFSSSKFGSNSLSYSFSESDSQGRTYKAVFLSFTGLSYSVSIVPEPMSWTLLIAGFGMIGCTMRRRSLIGPGRMTLGSC